MAQVKFWKTHLDFLHNDLLVIVGDTHQESMKFVKMIYNTDLSDIPDPDGWRAFVTWKPGEGIILFLKYGNISCDTICHEVTHITANLFRNAGIEYSEASEEAFAHHNGMLFKMIVKFLQRQKIKFSLFDALKDEV